MPKSGTLRRALPPLGAMVGLGLIAGMMVGHQVSLDLRDPAAPATITPALVGALSTPKAAPAPPAGKRAEQASNGTFRFLLVQPDQVTPIRWNPCAPVHYKVATNKLVPASEVRQVQVAFGVLGKALGGVDFVYDGPTDVVPDAVDDSARAGTDVVFAFARPGTGVTGSDLLNGWEAGRGGFAAWGPTRADGSVSERPTHGSVVVDADKWSVMSRHDRTLLYLHELGHVAGLDHPQATDQVMSSGAYDLPLRYQAGDLAGLAQLGRQAGCTG
jgi:hypothetical protein